MALLKYNDSPENYDCIGTAIVDCCFHVHKNLGAGYPERIYEAALCYELTKCNIAFEQQKVIRLTYPPNIILDPEYRLDLVIEDKIILELKSVEKIAPVHNA